MLLRILLSILLFSVPSISYAKQETVWDFQKGIPGLWNVRGCTMARQTAEGFSFATKEERCQVQRKTDDLRHPIDTLSLTTLSSTSTDIVFLWHRQNSPKNHMVELPLTLPGSVEAQPLHLNLPAYRQWDAATDRIGFSLPPHSSFILQNIAFTRWSLWEQTIAAFKSFWTFDTFRPYAINFLWGPVIGWNPVWQEQLFLKIPPRGWSGNRLFAFVILPLFGIFLLFRRRTALLFFGSVFISLWLLSDLRMGLEILSYVRSDWQNYILQPPGKRNFRVFDTFPTMVDAVLPILTSRERFGFAGPPGTPFGSFLRYRTYPTVLIDAERPAEEREGIRHWFVVLRPDTSIGPKGELFLGEEQLSPPGTVIQNFENNAILFEVTDPSTSL